MTIRNELICLKKRTVGNTESLAWDLMEVELQATDRNYGSMGITQYPQPSQTQRENAKTSS